MQLHFEADSLLTMLAGNIEMCILQETVEYHASMGMMVFSRANLLVDINDALCRGDYNHSTPLTDNHAHGATIGVKVDFALGSIHSSV